MTVEDLTTLTFTYLPVEANTTELDLEINKRNRVAFGYQYVLKDVAFAFLNTTNLEFILDEDKTVLQTHSLYGNYVYKNAKLFDVEVGKF